MATSLRTELLNGSTCGLAARMRAHAALHVDDNVQRWERNIVEVAPHAVVLPLTHRATFLVDRKVKSKIVAGVLPLRI